VSVDLGALADRVLRERTSAGDNWGWPFNGYIPPPERAAFRLDALLPDHWAVRRLAEEYVICWYYPNGWAGDCEGYLRFAAIDFGRGTWWWIDPGEP
jgi:hypothetical protein